MAVYRAGTNKSSTNVFPSIRPSLDLDFANSKTLDPRITYSRASGGTYVGADGLIKYAGVNEPRFTYDQNTGESLGLMIEDGGTNLVTRSQDFDDAAWGKNSCSVLSNVEIAPDGTLTADKIVDNTTSSVFKFLSRSVGTTSGQYTLSVFLKAGERFRGYIQLLTATVNSAIFFDLKTGTITTGVGINTITKYPNGWYRISTSSLYTSDTGTIYIVMQDNNGVNSYIGDGVSGMYVWGAQLEPQSTNPITVPSSYIPTLGSARTRSRDDTQIIGKNFTSFYNQSGGTVFSDITTVTVRGDNTANNSFDRAYAFTTSNFNLDGINLTLFRTLSQRRYNFEIADNAVDLGSLSLGPGTIETINTFPRAKICVAFQPRNITSYINNLKSPQVFPRKLITCDRLFLGKPQRFQATPYIIISRFTYFPKVLTEDQVRVLTR
jgi:hypothetical protein